MEEKLKEIFETVFDISLNDDKSWEELEKKIYQDNLQFFYLPKMLEQAFDIKLFPDEIERMKSGFNTVVYIVKEKLKNHIQTQTKIKQLIPLELLNRYNEIMRIEGVKKLEIAVLNSYYVDILEEVMTVQLSDKGIYSNFWFGGCNRYPQEIIQKDPALYSADIVIFQVLIEDICPNISEGDYSEIYDYIGHVKKLREQTSAVIIASNFTVPYFSGAYSYDEQNNRIFNTIRKVNVIFNEQLFDIKQCYILDTDDIVSSVGKTKAYDVRMKFISSNPYSFDFYMRFGQKAARIIDCVYGKRKKCIVLDLDNTLWDGIIGEGTVDINDSFKQFQRELLKIRNSGVLLAINSKNNYEDAIRVIETNKDMVLKSEHFACKKINWNNKCQNLREIAAELNIGLDSIVFIDDSCFECEFVREQIPEVTVIHLDGDYYHYVDLIRNTDCLNYVTLTEEDRNRNELYKNIVKRKNLQNESGNLEDFLKKLNIKLEFEMLNSDNIARAAILTQKTNQFNLTTVRYTQKELKQKQENGCIIFIVRAKDDIGDEGIVGLMVLEPNGDNMYIDTFLLSCRVMQRNIEYAMMSYAVKTVKSEGVKMLTGKYIPTEKNIPVENLYKDMGFEKHGEYYVFSVDKVIETPNYLHVC